MSNLNNNIEPDEAVEEPVSIHQLRKNLATDIDDLIYQVNPVNRIKDAEPKRLVLAGASVAVVAAGILLAIMYRRK